MSLDQIVLMDIDGTLSDTSQREHLVPRGEARNVCEAWDTFVGASVDDAPLPAGVRLSNTLAKTHSIYVLTSRAEKHRKITEAWLRRHRVRYDTLLMREDGDHRRAADVKAEIVLRLIGDGEQIVLAVDDEPGNVAALRHLGIPTIQVVP